MGSNQELDTKVVIRSTLFVTCFWSMTALLFYGLFMLFDAIDISAIICSILNA